MGDGLQSVVSVHGLVRIEARRDLRQAPEPEKSGQKHYRQDGKKFKFRAHGFILPENNAMIVRTCRRLFTENIARGVFQR